MRLGLPRRRVRLDPPVSAVDGNVIFARGAAAGVYRVQTKSFEFLSKAEKHKLHGQLAVWYMKVGSSFSIWRVCRDHDVDTYVRETASLVDESYASAESWRALLETHANRMRSMCSFTPEIYFVVSLQSRMRIPFVQADRSDTHVNDAEADAFRTLCDYLPAKRATTLEIQWALRKMSVRGVCEPDVDPSWAPPALSLDGGVWSPGRADVQSFVPVVEDRGRSVLVSGEDGKSLQTVLAMGKLPKSSDFPGDAEMLFAPLERLDFPVDAFVHVQWIPNKKMLAICDDAIKKAGDEVQDAAARFLDRKTKRRMHEAEAAQDYFASEPYPPGLDAPISFVIGVEPGQERLLSERVSRLSRAYGQRVKIFRPFGIQPQLFDASLLRPDGAVPSEYRRDYRRLMNAEEFAAMMVIGANEGGAARGPYIAHTIGGVKRAYRYDMLEASATNRSGAILLSGDLGSGKSHAVQILGFVCARRGSLVSDIDPKRPMPDHKLDLLPGLEGKVHTISLNDLERHRGRLDPLVVAPVEMREELASGYMMNIIPDIKADWRTSIVEAVRAELTTASPCSWNVVERLLSSSDKHDRAAGKALRTWSDWGPGKLAFSRSGDQDVNPVRQVTMIKASKLILPPPGALRGSYTQSETFGVETLKLIIAREMKTLSVDRTVHKMLIVDEAHVFGSTTDGLKFLEEIIRMGRYMNITVVLSSQLIADFAALGELIGIRFVFRQQTDTQARANLFAIGLDGDDGSLVEKVLGFSEGRCFARGLDKRVVALRFDPADPEILKILDTKPTADLASTEALAAV